METHPETSARILHDLIESLLGDRTWRDVPDVVAMLRTLARAALFDQHGMTGVAHFERLQGMSRTPPPPPECEMEEPGEYPMASPLTYSHKMLDQPEFDPDDLPAVMRAFFKEHPDWFN